jgi:hypothetical protein
MRTTHNLTLPSPRLPSPNPSPPFLTPPLRLRLDMFMHGFGVITLKLKEMYQMITLGGDAELELVDSLDPFSGRG